MSYKDDRYRTTANVKDLKSHLLQSLGNNSMLSQDKYFVENQIKHDAGKNTDPDCMFLNADYPSGDSAGVTDLQFHMSSGCQEVVPQSDTLSEAAATPLSHQELVESLDRLSTPSQLTNTWVWRNRRAQQLMQTHYANHGEVNRTYSDDIDKNEMIDWDDRLCPQEGAVTEQLEDSQQPPDVLEVIEHSLHDHIDAELDSLRINLHNLVADQQVHFRRYLSKPTQYSDEEDADILSNQEDFSGPQSAMNMDDTGWSSDCMQDTCSTLNEPTKLEDASSDSAVGMQDEIICQQQQQQQQPDAVINRLTEDCEIQSILLQLQTTAAVLSHTLRRQEYSTS